MDGEGKPVEWLGSSLDDLRDCPEDARREAGFQQDRVQHGLMPKDRKPMPTVGPGAMEIRIRTGAPRALRLEVRGGGVRPPRV